MVFHAWAPPTYVNAYNNIKKNDKVFSSSGVLLGTASGCFARCTAKKPGSVQLETGQWISGKAQRTNEGWKLAPA